MPVFTAVHTRENSTQVRIVNRLLPHIGNYIFAIFLNVIGFVIFIFHQGSVVISSIDQGTVAILLTIKVAKQGEDIIRAVLIPLGYQQKIG